MTREGVGTFDVSQGSVSRFDASFVTVDPFDGNTMLLEKTFV